MSLKILVTGGAGYLGSIMVPALLNEGHQVTVVDNFMYQQNSLASICRNSKFSVVNSDVRIESNLYPLLNKADAIIPLAALVGAPLCDKDPVTATTVNKESVLKMLKHISKNQWVIMPTTNSAYGTGDKNNHCDENSPLNPISLYAKDKVMVEKELMERENSISYRLATVFGMSPRMRIDLLVNDFTYRAMTDRAVVLFESGFKRNYIHNFDVTRAFIHGLNHFSKMKGQVYNVGLSEANLSKKELCLAIQKHIPAFSFVESQIGKDPDQRNYIVSNEKIEATGFKTAVTLDDGIQELIKGYTMIRNARYGNV